jgi:hypothetical protein
MELANARGQVQHIRASRRAEVLLSLFQIAGGVVFEVRMVPPQSVVTDVIGAGVMVRNDDAGEVAALPADDLATGERIDPTETGMDRQVAVNPTRLQRSVISGSQVRPNRPRSVGEDGAMNVFNPKKWPRVECIFVFCLRVEVVYTSVERIQFSPPKGRWLALQRGPLLFGAMGCDHSCRRPERTNEGGPVPTAKQPYQNSGDRIKIGLPYQNRIITGRVDRQKDVG